MRIIKYLLIVVAVQTLLVFNVSIVKAQQWCGGCQVTCNIYEVDPGNFQEICIDGCAGCTITYCQAGEYLAPDNECHDVGTETPETCFPAGTEISMADGSRKNIEEVEIGDSVMSQSEGGVRSSSVVTQLIQPVSDNMCEIKFDEGESLRVTKSHPLATTEGWKAIDIVSAARERESVPVTALEIGDYMVKESGEARVQEIACWDEQVQTYNFTVDNDHTYFAEGYLAHNKGGGCEYRPVDCPNGWTRSGNAIRNNCDSNLYPGRDCTPYGTAQQATGCCREKCWADDDCACLKEEVTTYECCPPGTVSTPRTVYDPVYTVNINPCTGENMGAGLYNCYPDKFISWVENGYQCGTTPKDEEGQRYPIYTGTKTCRPQARTVYDCVSVCSSTAPTNLSVTQGASATAATLSWRSGTGGSSQIVYVGTNQNSVNNDCAYGGCIVSGAPLTPFYANSNFSYPVTGMSTNTTYYFRVVTQENSGCRPSATVSYTVPNLTLSGRVYLDSNNNCSTSTPWSLGGLTVSVRGTAYSGSVGSDGRFGFYGGTSNPISYLDLAGYSSSYVPSTATGCNLGATLTSVANPSSTNYYYLTPRREAWWQAVGGSIYSSGNVRSELPSAGEYLIAPGAGGALGALMRATGSVDTGAGAVSTEGYSAVTTYRGKRMNYDYFAAHMGVTRNQENDWVTDSLSKPANDPDTVFYYHEPSGSEASVNSPWNVAAGESYIVFVDGDLRIASDITVEEGGFLAFIVDGSMRVSPAVTTISGLYVIDGSLITESNGTADVAANFEGSVVAWSGVNMGRDLVGNNLGTPAESFAYRPDLLVNMPDAMKVFALRWQEVVPGSYGE